MCQCVRLSEHVFDCAYLVRFCSRFCLLHLHSFMQTHIISNFFFVIFLQIILPPGTNVPESYGSGSDEDQVLYLSASIITPYPVLLSPSTITLYSV